MYVAYPRTDKHEYSYTNVPFHNNFKLVMELQMSLSLHKRSFSATSSNILKVNIKLQLGEKTGNQQAYS